MTLFASYSYCQDRQELEAQRFEIIKEIDNTNRLLLEAAKNKKALTSDLTIRNKQIQNRKELLKRIGDEILLVDASILETSKKKIIYEAGVDSLKGQYQVLLRAVYREKVMKDPLVTLLSSRSMSAAILKANYFDRLKQYVANKVSEIRDQQEKLDTEIEVLRKERGKKEAFLLEVREQESLLVNELDRQKVLISSLKEDEVSLKENLALQKSEREELNIAIESVINSKFGGNFTSSNNERSTNSLFASSKGKLNWPVVGGVVISKYGKQRHPTVSNLTISNNGIDIRAPRASQVKSVAEGTVAGVSEMAGYGKTIIIDHKGYYSVYSKLGETFVRKGDKVTLMQSIGILSEKDNVSELHFEIWENNQKQNPENWLK